MPTERPIITFLTDFGLDGAAATCRAVMLSICREAQIIDIAHTIRKYAIRDGAFVLRFSLPYAPVGVHVAVVDPGVGTERRPIAIRTGRGDVLVGPDNGLLVGPAEVLGEIDEVRELTNRTLWLPVTSSTFHGRDIFAPTAAHLAAGTTRYESLGPPIAAEDLVRLPDPVARVDGDSLETEVTYVDSFGNARLAGGRDELESAFRGVRTGRRLNVSTDGEKTLVVTFAPSFGHVPPGDAVLYVDSSGHLALAENQGDLAGRTGLQIGAPITIRPA